jgi:hypothetical protein
VDDEKLKDPRDVASAFSNFFTTIAEKINIQQRKKNYLNSKRFISWKLPKHKNHPNH